MHFDESMQWHGGYYKHTETLANWPMMLRILRSHELTAKTASRLLKGCCCYLPVHRSMPVADSPWVVDQETSSWDVDAVEHLMPLLRRLQRAVHSVYKPKVPKPIEPQKPTEAEKRAHTAKLNVLMPSLEKKLIKYLKQRPGNADIPPKGPGRITELLDAVEQAAKAEGKTVQEAMQTIAPGGPTLRTIKEPEPNPDEVLRHVLNKFSSDIAAQMTFGADGPTVIFTPLNPVAAMLLAAHDHAVKHPQQWAVCKNPNCCKPFKLPRIPRPTCSDRCRNYVKRRKHLDEKKAAKAQSTNRRSVVNG